ncbi:hypothetical protein [Ensifer sp.]|uniref:hypothetical protein n=1 Tax=Ensifer sp. TaxID=1872086 RepID=UPI002E112022|nr:hypothetical protein [Ensifer sp.]
MPFGDETSAIWSLPDQSFWQRSGAGHASNSCGNGSNTVGRSAAVGRKMQAASGCCCHPVNAYYEAQRRAACSRAQGNAGDYWHWSRIASEVARIEPRAETDFEVVRAIADQETTGRC